MKKYLCVLMGIDKGRGHPLGRGLIVRRAILLLQHQCQPPGGRMFLEMDSVPSGNNLTN